MTPRQPIQIFLPCEIFEVQWVEGGKGLTPLESLVLEAIHAGVDHFHDLAHLFELGQRPMLDLILDLWKCSHVQIDVQEGRISLPTDIRRRVEDDRRRRLGLEVLADSGGLGALAGTRRPDRLELMMELISGHFLPLVPLVDRPSRGRVAPENLPRGAYRRGNRTALVTVVRDQLRRKGRSTSAQVSEVFLDLEVPGAERRAQTRTRLVRVDVDPRLGGHGELVFEVRPSWYLRATARRDIAARLQLSAEATPEHPFFRQLREYAEQAERGDAPELDEQVRTLVRDVEKARSLREQSRPAEMIFERHEALAAVAESIGDLLHARACSTGNFETLDAGRQRAWLVEALQGARRQVVICSPSPRYTRLSPLLPYIKEALERGVRLVVLWGTRREEILDGPVHTALGELEFKHPGLVCWSPLPTRTNASFAILDSDALLLAPLDLLGGDRGDDRPIANGLLFQAQQRGSGEGVIAWALEWLRVHCPNYETGQKILMDVDFAERSTLAREPVIALPEVPDLPVAARRLEHLERENEEEVQRALREPIGPDLVGIWQQDWATHASAVAELVRQIPPNAEIVEDGQHRVWLWRIIETASTFLVLSSPEIGKDVIDAHLLAKLEAQMKREAGLSVVLIGSRVRDPWLSAELSAFIKRQRGRALLHLTPCATSMAANEDRAVLSSFGFLSNDGYYAPSTRRRQRSELGLALRGPEVVAALMGPLESHVPGLRDLLRPRAVNAVALAPYSAQAPAPVAGHLQLLLDGLGKARTPLERGEAARRWVVASQDERGAPWADLERLLTLASRHGEGLVTWGDVRTAVSSLLLARWGQGDNGNRELWLAWLVVECWQAGDFHEAWALRTFLDECCPGASVVSLPSAALARLAIGHGVPGQMDTAIEAWAQAGTPSKDEQLAAWFLAAREVLTTGAISAGQLMMALSSVMEGPFAALCAACERYWVAAGRSVPFQIVGKLVSLEEEERQVETARARAAAEVQHARHTSFTFRIGFLAWAHLMQAGAEIPRLEDSVSRADWRGAKAIFEEELTVKNLDAAKLLDRAVAAVADRVTAAQTVALIGSKRRACVDRLRTVLETVSIWVNAASDYHQRKDEGRLTRDVLRLARDLRSARPELAAEQHQASEDRRIYAPALEQLLATIRPLTDLTREDA